MTDIALFHTADGGEVEIVNGEIALDHTPRTAVYLSMFGGNDQDGGTQATEHLQWWGNLIEPETTRRYRCETQHILRALPAVSANLPRVSDAVKRDLEWMERALGAVVSTRVSIPARRRIEIEIRLEVDGEPYPLAFNESWGPE